MTINEVLTLARAFADENGFRWVVNKGKLRIGTRPCRYCPLTAAVLHVYRKHRYLHDWQLAAADLGLSPVDADDIVMAADHEESSENSLRQQMKQVLLPQTDGGLT